MQENTNAPAAPAAPAAPRALMLPKQSKPWGVCGEGGGRYARDAIEVDERAGTLIATNGRAAVFLMLDGPSATGSDPYLIPGDKLKAARTLAKAAPLRIEGGSVGALAGDHRVMDEDGAHPDVRRVVRAVPTMDAVSVTLDVDLLRQLADAFGSSKLTLRLSVEPKDWCAKTAESVPYYGAPVMVSPMESVFGARGSFGVIMPIQATEQVGVIRSEFASPPIPSRRVGPFVTKAPGAAQTEASA